MIDINPKDISIKKYILKENGFGLDYYGIELTYLPLKIVVRAENEGSEHKNREECVRLLKEILNNRVTNSGEEMPFSTSIITPTENTIKTTPEDVDRLERLLNILKEFEKLSENNKEIFKFMVGKL